MRIDPTRRGGTRMAVVLGWQHDRFTLSRLTWDLRVVAALLPVLLLSGCQIPEPTTLPHPTMGYYSDADLYRHDRPLRVALLPIINETEHAMATQLIRDALIGELTGTHVVQVVSVPPRSACALGPSPADHIAQLAAIRDQHDVDAVLHTRLNDYHSYWPPRIGLTIDVISTSDAKTLLSVNGQWDARNSYVMEQFDEYAKASSLASAYGSSYFAIQSPQHFSKFVVHQIAAMVIYGIPKPQPPPSTEGLAADIQGQLYHRHQRPRAMRLSSPALRAAFRTFQGSIFSWTAPF